MQMNENKKCVFVSILGKPNVGKSSLLNMLVNSKISIVSPKSQTTRNRVIGILTENNIQLIFIDTPGIHKSVTKLGDYMNSEVNNSFSGSEVCLHVIEAGKKISELDLELIQKFIKLRLNVILVINKIDLTKDKSELIKQIQEFNENFEYNSIVPVSAKTQDGRNELLSEIKKFAVPSVFYYSEDEITDQTERKLASEIIREKILYFLDKELPHGTGIYIENYKEIKNNTRNIHAVIYCDRESHKKIIIGAQGQMIKKIGTEARKSLEYILDCKVNLNLFVKVKEDWRNKDSVLKILGYV